MARKAEVYGPNIIADPRRPGKLYVRIYHAGVMYKRRAASLSHARDKVHEIKAAIARGEWPPKPKPKVPLFDELVEAYREEKRREGKSVMGCEIGYRRLLERFGGRRADSIATREVKEWRDALLEGHTPATVNRHLAMLGAILRMGVRDRKIEAGTIPEINPFTENNKRLRYLTDDEEPRLLGELPERLRPLIVAAIHTGMRRGELLNLRWNDIDLVSGTIHVREAKSGEGRRLPMNSVARAALMQLRKERRARLRGKVVSRSEASGYVFTAPEGGFLHDLNRYWYPALECATIADLHFHDLRHTFASRYMMAGGNLYSLQILMGHKTAAMVQRYAHLSREHLQAEVERLAAERPKPRAKAGEGQ